MVIVKVGAPRPCQPPHNTCIQTLLQLHVLWNFPEAICPTIVIVQHYPHRLHEKLYKGVARKGRRPPC